MACTQTYLGEQEEEDEEDKKKMKMSERLKRMWIRMRTRMCSAAVLLELVRR